MHFVAFKKIDDPLPERLTGRDMVVEKESYRTTTGEYCVKPNPNKAMERADCGINCRRVIFMTGVDKAVSISSLLADLPACILVNTVNTFIYV